MARSALQFRKWQLIDMG